MTWTWDDDAEEMSTKLSTAVLILIDKGAPREAVVNFAGETYDRLIKLRKPDTRPALRSIPLPKANEGSWDDACAGCGYLPQHCECD